MSNDSNIRNATIAVDDITPISDNLHEYEIQWTDNVHGFNNTVIFFQVGIINLFALRKDLT